MFFKLSQSTPLQPFFTLLWLLSCRKSGIWSPSILTGSARPDPSSSLDQLIVMTSRYTLRPLQKGFQKLVQFVTGEALIIPAPGPFPEDFRSRAQTFQLRQVRRRPVPFDETFQGHQEAKVGEVRRIFDIFNIGAELFKIPGPDAALF